MKIYHRSRKFAIVMFALIFLNSVIILELRGYQRRQNLNLLQSKLKNESNKEVFNYIEEKSKTEDLILLISTNFIALMITVGFDRFGVFEESDETIKENKKKQKNVVIKEIRIKPHIDEHDKETKISQIEKFIAKEHKVKVSLRLTGRERLHAESAIKVLDEFASHFEETATVEKKYGKEQVQKFILLSPKK